MYYYQTDGVLAASYLPELPFEPAAPGAPALFLTERSSGPAAFRAACTHHLTEPAGVRWLDAKAGSALDHPLTAVNLRHPRWRDALSFPAPKPGKKRVHLLAVGDVEAACAVNTHHLELACQCIKAHLSELPHNENRG